MLKFLIADDHEIVRRGIKQILREKFSNTHFEEAADSITLVEKAATHDWDIIVSDMLMSGESKSYTLKQLFKQIQRIPVLILSVYPEEQCASKAIEAGAAGYLAKDATPEQLVSAVEMILSGSRSVTSNNLI